MIGKKSRLNKSRKFNQDIKANTAQVSISRTPS